MTAVIPPTASATTLVRFSKTIKATGRQSATLTLSSKTLHPTRGHLLPSQEAEHVCKVSFTRAQGVLTRAA